MISAAFPICLSQPGILYSFGDAIYNPDGVSIPVPLMIHEQVHGFRQRKAGDVEQWWTQYCRDRRFRLDEEIPAHQAEYKAFCEAPGLTRTDRRTGLKLIALRLSSAIYGNMISYERARELIRSKER
jgi:hypothetical protein